MRVRVVGICGGSGAGKTTLARLLARQLEGACGLTPGVLAFDSYYRDLSHLPMSERRVHNYDHPDALDHALFIRHLDSLKAGSAVEPPEYDFASHTIIGRHVPIAPSPVVLVEGILLLAFDEIASRLDVSLFLDVCEAERLRRRILRDTAERGRHPEDVRRQFAATVAPMHDDFVQPSRWRADWIVPEDVPFHDLAGEVLAELGIGDGDDALAHAAKAAL